MSDPKNWESTRNARHSAGRIRRRLRHWLAISVLVALIAAPSTLVQAQGPTQVTFSGAGWGHGVGMSQYGARNMGAQGFTYPEILDHYYEGTELAAVLAPENMRVHLADIAEVTLASTGPLTFTIPGQVDQQMPAGSSVTIRAADGGLQIGPSLWVPVSPTSPVLVSYPNPVRVSATGHNYIWGKLQLTVADGKVRVVESNLTMEQYTQGIAEMPASWPAEALAAQAIAARTYAHYMAADRRADPEWTREFDIYGSTLDQNYEGFDAAHVNWLAAVERTAHEELTWQGNTVKAYYSATNGGATEAAGYVFDVDLPYTSVREDVFDTPNPWSPWERTYTVDELSRYFSRATDTSVGLLQDLRITGAASGSGRIDRVNVELVGSNGTKVITGRRMMVVINAGVFAEGGGLDRHVPSTRLALGPGGPPDTSALPSSGAASQPMAADGGAEVIISDTPLPSEVIAQTQPVAELSALRAISGAQVLIDGWAFDPLAPTEATMVDVYLDRIRVAEVLADLDRPATAEAHPEAGAAHGFTTQVELDSPGAHELCVVARKYNDEVGISLGCTWVVAHEINGEVGTAALSAASSGG